MKTAPKHIFFDLDNTLTPSKSLILPEHAPIFASLCAVKDVIIVSGHGAHDIRAHLAPAGDCKYFVLGQNGNRAEGVGGEVLWNNSLTQTQKDAILVFIARVREHLKYKVRDENDIVDDRDSQIAFSLIGHHEDKAKKDRFDPKHEIRLGVLKTFADDVKKLEGANVEVRSGGSTVLDFFELGKNKGYNVAHFIETKGWKREDCLYIGDALFPGGNDETVIGVIPTHAVQNPDDTFRFIKENLVS